MHGLERMVAKKDSLTLTENFPQVNDQKASEKNFPINVTEARAYFERLDLNPSSSFGDGESYTFLKTIEPDWNLAFIGYSQSGKEIVTIPLADSSLSALNQGRAGAKLIFSKTTEDSISVSILIFLADTAYYQGNAGVLNFNTFTGLYLLLDIGQHFEAGLNVIAGSPVGRVKAINQMGSQNSPEYREDAEDEDCPRTFESMLIPCDVVFACIDGFQLITVESADCTDAVWPTGGGGSGEVAAEEVAAAALTLPIFGAFFILICPWKSSSKTAVRFLRALILRALNISLKSIRFIT
ncbi:MAG: hypothetical protein IPJ82_00360 [Lewinellaceae bacterium]|nr:hypothetical protein [Lewinellaceae bacterium]